LFIVVRQADTSRQTWRHTWKAGDSHAVKETGTIQKPRYKRRSKGFGETQFMRRIATLRASPRER